MCEEFGCLPSAAYREWQRLPAGLLETIVEFRTYARVKAAYDHDPTPTPDDGLIRQVVQILDFELAAEEIHGRDA